MKLFVRLFFFLFLVFFSQRGYSQIQKVAPLDSFRLLSSRLKLGDKWLFTDIQKRVWITDGSAEGTREFTFPAENRNILIRISEDSLLIQSFPHPWSVQESRFYLYTSQMAEPLFICKITDKFDEIKRTERLGDKLIINSDHAFYQIDLTNKKYDTFKSVKIPRIYNSFWTVKGNKIIATNVDQSFFEIYSIDVEESTVKKELELPYKVRSFIPVFENGKILLYGNDQLSIFDIESNNLETLIAFPDTNNPNSVNIKAYTVSNRIIIVLRLDEEQVIVGTNGVDETQIIKSSPKPSGSSFSTTQLGDKIIFLSENKIHVTDGTKSGTTSLPIPGNKIISNVYMSNTSGNGFLVKVGDGDRVSLAFITKDLDFISIEPEDFEKYRFYPTWYYATPKKCYFSMLHLEHGIEMHRLDFVTKKTEFVSNGSESIASSGIKPIGDINGNFLFTNRHLYEYELSSINDTVKLHSPESLVLDNYIWAERIGAATQVDALKGDENNNTTVAFQAKRGYFNKLYFYFNEKKFSDSLSNHYLAKFNPKGQLIWTKVLSFISNDVTQYAIGFDDENNTVVALMMEKTSLEIEEHIFKKDNGALLIVKLDPFGKFLWGTQAKVHQFSKIRSVVFGKKNAFFVLGKFAGDEAYFEDVILHSSRNPTAFIAKYTKNGKFLWAKESPLPSQWPIDNGNSNLAVHENMVFLAQDMAKIEYPVGLTIMRLECADYKHRIQLSGFASSNGEKMWQREIQASDFCYISDIAVSPLGHAFVVGGYTGNISFDEVKLKSDSCGQFNSFLFELDENGQIIHAQKMDLINPQIYQIKFDKDSNYYLTGLEQIPSFNNHNNYFRDFNLEYNSSTHPFYYSFFVRKYNKIGQLMASKKIDGNSKGYFTNIFYYNIAMDVTAEKEVILASRFSYNLDSFNITTATSRRGLFLSKFSLYGNPDLIEPNIVINEDSVFLFPNPISDFLKLNSTDVDFAQASIIIYSVDGRQWQLPQDRNHGHVRIDTRSLAQGMYFVVIRLNKEIIVKKIVKISK